MSESKTTPSIKRDIDLVRAQLEWHRDYGSDAGEEMIETISAFERIIIALENKDG